MSIRVPALAMEQTPGRTIFAFGINGKLVPDFAVVSRARREGDDVSLLGYQRPEVQRHIAEIRDYLMSENAVLPNAVVLAFDSRVRFVEDDRYADAERRVRPGHLEIPLSTSHEEKVGFVVDGQQRLAAIREAKCEQFPIYVIGFVAETDEEQREQFLLVNATKPLPRGLIHELLPGINGRLPSHLQQRQMPARLVEVLNNRPESPLYKTIRTATNPGGRIADNSMLRVFEASLSDGVLWEIGQIEDDEDQAFECMVQLHCDFWAAVRHVWSDIWDLKPRKSRLLHGAGVVSLGYLLEQMVARCGDETLPDVEYFVGELERIKPECRWTSGWWDFGDGQRRRWDEVQNISRDVSMLANQLTRTYRLLLRAR